MQGGWIQQSRRVFPI